MQYDDLPKWLQEKVEEHCNLSIECPDGWRDICLGTLTEVRKLDPDFTLTCVKEKFGVLQINIHISWMQYDRPYDDYIDELSVDQTEKNERIWDLLELAYVKSANACDDCGEGPAETHAWNGWWIRTLCGRHAAAEKAKAMEAEDRHVH